LLLILLVFGYTVFVDFPAPKFFEFRHQGLKTILKYLLRNAQGGGWVAIAQKFKDC